MSSPESPILEGQLQISSITSLRRLQALYGALAEAGGAKGGDARYSIYYTPGQLEPFVADADDTDRYVARVDVDLTDPGAVDLEDLDVEIEPLTDDLVPRLGFSRYPWGRGIDHSITRRGAQGGSDASTVATYCIECLKRWTDADDREPAIGQTAKEHPDGWIIETLQNLGLDSDVQDHIEHAIDRQLAGAPRVTATVRLKLDPEVLTEAPGDSADEVDWFYPGEIDVLNSAMKARNEEKLARKNLDDNDESSRGEAVCMITGEKTEVFGTTEDPLALYTVQHADQFDGLSREQSWRGHPVSSDAALLVNAGSSLVEACRTTRNGLSVYTMPYFTAINEERAELLYRALDRLQERSVPATEEHPMVFIERIVEEHGTEGDRADLRFYVISLRNDAGDINVFYDVPDVTLYWPRQVAKAYVRVLTESAAFSPWAGFAPDRGWSLLSPELEVRDVVNAIVSGSFAWNAVYQDPTGDGATVDDNVEWYTYHLLTGSPVPVERMFELFVKRLESERQDDPENRLSLNHLKVQLAQLDALSQAGLLQTENSPQTPTTPTRMQTNDIDVSQLVTEDGAVSRSAARRHRLEQFIESREALAESLERRGAFLIGVLVGQLSHHQRYSRNMNRTIRDQHQAENMSAGKLKRLYSDLIDKAGIYASQADWAGETLFEETIDALTDTLSAAPPDDWKLSRYDMQFYYALGVGYGVRAEGRVSDLIERVEAAAAQETN